MRNTQDPRNEAARQPRKEARKEEDIEGETIFQIDGINRESEE